MAHRRDASKHRAPFHTGIKENSTSTSQELHEKSAILTFDAKVGFRPRKENTVLLSFDSKKPS